MNDEWVPENLFKQMLAQRVDYYHINQLSYCFPPMIDVKEFLFSLPSKVPPEAIEGMSTLFHFDIADAGAFTIKLEDGKMDVSEGLNGDATCKVTTSAESFSKLLSRELNPMMAMMTGKLKISNPGEMLKYAKMFGLM